MTSRTHSIALVCVLALAATAGDAAAAFIPVTTLVQKISSTGGCSLQEAIYSANLHSNIAIDATAPDHFIVTQCVAGTGNDTIELPTGGVFQLSNSLDTDAYNFTGPTATPIIFSTITIEGAGATLEWVGTGNARLFAVGPATISDTPSVVPVSGTGNLTLRNAYVKGFHVKGGDGAGAGGGGLGAGGAIYVMSGSLTVENSTFDSNGATGGNGSQGECRGGGGGLGGNGAGSDGFGGGGGGGSGRNGGTGTSSTDQKVGYGGGGGGTVLPGANATAAGALGGALCGGSGGVRGSDGGAGQCPGGGGGGSGADVQCRFCGPNGGQGNYGGGGGGGDASGGNGGFGGGGGAGAAGIGSGNGGKGGFGGGGGGSGDFSEAHAGTGGPLGGDGTKSCTGGGGAALGGAIFNDSGTVTVQNSTFTNNFVVRGMGGPGADNGADGGGTIFSRSGSLTVVDATISGNQSTGSGGGIVVYEDGSSTSFTLDDTIVANNGANECFVLGSVTAGGVANVIMSNGSGDALGACPGVVTNSDPQLGPLQLNGGNTLTLAIPKTSPAWGTADAGTSLPTDQRGMPRPSLDGHSFDIGAFELCTPFRPAVSPAPCIQMSIGSTAALTIQVSPMEGGTTTPDAGSYNEPLDSVIVLTAMPNQGYSFTNWTGNVADSTNPSTTVTMDQAQTVTANFSVPCVGDCNNDSHVTIDELLTLANIALGTAQPSACAARIPNGADVNVALIVQAVNNALNGCPSATAPAQRTEQLTVGHSVWCQTPQTSLVCLSPVLDEGGQQVGQISFSVIRGAASFTTGYISFYDNSGNQTLVATNWTGTQTGGVYSGTFSGTATSGTPFSGIVSFTTTTYAHQEGGGRVGVRTVTSDMVTGGSGALTE